MALYIGSRQGHCGVRASELGFLRQLLVRVKDGETGAREKVTVTARVKAGQTGPESALFSSTTGHRCAHISWRLIVPYRTIADRACYEESSE